MTGILSGKYNDLFPAISLSFILGYKFKNGLMIGVECDGGIERIAAVAFETFDTKHIEMEIISMDKRVFDDLSGRVEIIEKQVERLCAGQKSPGLKRWFDNQDVCMMLGISKRTLQTYREKGLLPFSLIRHKILYRPEDVEKLLLSSHHPNE